MPRTIATPTTSPDTPAADSERLDYARAATHLGVKLATLRSMVHRRQVPHIRLGKALVVFDRGQLDAWLAARSVPVNA